MSTRTQPRDSWTVQFGVRLVTISLLFVGIAGCAPAVVQTAEPTTAPPVVEATQPIDPVTALPAVEATLPSGWESYTSPGRCGYTISYPADMEGANQGMYSWSLQAASTEPVGLITNFIYVSVIPADFQGGPGEIYNYDPAAAQALLGLQVGESKSVNPVPDMAPWSTYTRLADTTLGNLAAQAYENTQPWEFPAGTKETRYYLLGNGCTYLVGGYMNTLGSGDPGALSQERFEEIVATFQVNP